MARRHDTFDDGSLELLLDTITNAFGGILFLAILVVVLLKGTGQKMSPSEPVAEVDLVSLTDQLEQLEAELATTEIELRAAEAVSTNLAAPDLKETITELHQQRRLRDRLNDDKSRLARQLAMSQKQVKDIAAKSESLTRELADEKDALERLRSNLDQERAKRKIKSPFPEERAATKSDYSVTIRYGRWYVQRSPAGSPNLDDFAVLNNEGEYLTITPKPYRGIPIIEGEQLSRRIESLLKSKDPNREYVCISIWDDSYDEFQCVRDCLVENGFEYRLLAVTDGDEITEGFVPNPQVQ